MRRPQLSHVENGAPSGWRRRGHRHHTVTVWATVILSLALCRDPAAAAAPCWAPPVEAPVRDPFRQPDCVWCAGNRGIEFATPVGQPVRAVASGRVGFVGTVAGTGYLVVVHADGLRATYGNIANTTLNTDDPVVGGMRLGTTAGNFHFGLRDGDGYLDPAPFLGRWIRRARLVPIDGAVPRPAPPPELVCESLPPVALRR